MHKYIILAIAIISLSSCDYQELMELEINGNKYIFNEEQVIGAYQTISSQTISVVIANDNASNPTSITITIKNNIKGLYTCENGSNPMAEIYVTYDGETFSTAITGSTGSIDLITAGASLIEGTFEGTLKNNANTYTITVTNGKFSGRAY